jgi:predicted transcriptional regulator
VVSSSIFKEVDDYKIFIPEDLPKPFTVKELASAIHQPRQLANKMAYSLRELNLIEYAGRKGRAYLYTLPAIDFTS